MWRCRSWTRWADSSSLSSSWDLQLYQNGVALDVHTQRIGFRRVELIQEPLQEADRHGKGTTFLFEVNGVRMFMGGTHLPSPHDASMSPSDARMRCALHRLELDPGAQLLDGAGGGRLPRVVDALARWEPEHGAALGRGRVRAGRVL